MQLNLGMQLRPELKQLLAPRMIQSMEILQMPAFELQERIEQELQENPVLEIRDPSLDREFDEGGPPAQPDLDPDGPLVSDPNGEADFNRLEALSHEWSEHFNEDHRPSRNGLDDEGDKKHDAMQNMPSRPQSLIDYLTEQLPYLTATLEQIELVKYLIANLDDRGYLTTSLRELANLAPLVVTADELEYVLVNFLHKLDPAGVGARDYKECLLLQLTIDTPYRDTVATLILHHLDDIAHNRLPVIQKRTGLELTEIKEAIEVLKTLNPKPAGEFLATNTQYVVADIIVERSDAGGYDVRLADEWIPEVQISRKYIDMFRDKGHDPETRKYLQRKIQAAEWLRDAINQRRNTLEKVTKAIIAHQHAFLDKGPEYIEPLKMQQIADIVKVHVTTVSRAVDDKYVQTPRGLFPLKRFFGGGTKNEVTGEDVAWETIKRKLLELIKDEDKQNPLSDEDLVNKLNEAGYPVARRTVTKYRKMLAIPSSRERREWTG